MSANPLSPPPPEASPSPNEWVICLCAQWCGACREYRARFDEVALKFASLQFLWIDIEDEADLLHPMDVEDFPTLLLGAGSEPLFFGPLTPQAQTLERLIRSHLQDGPLRPLGQAAVAELLARITSAHPV